MHKTSTDVSRITFSGDSINILPYMPEAEGNIHCTFHELNWFTAAVFGLVEYLHRSNLLRSCSDSGTLASTEIAQ